MSLIDFLTDEIAFPSPVPTKFNCAKIKIGTWKNPKSFPSQHYCQENTSLHFCIINLPLCLLFLSYYIHTHLFINHVCIFPGDQLPTNERQVIFQNGTLLIKDVSPNDAGRYTCSVIQGRWTASEEVLVEVLVPPTIEPFNFADKLQEGWRTRVTCSAPLGDLPIR